MGGDTIVQKTDKAVHVFIVDLSEIRIGYIAFVTTYIEIKTHHLKVGGVKDNSPLRK